MSDAWDQALANTSSEQASGDPWDLAISKSKPQETTSAVADPWDEALSKSKVSSPTPETDKALASTKAKTQREEWLAWAEQKNKEHPLITNAAGAAGDLVKALPEFAAKVPEFALAAGKIVTGQDRQGGVETLVEEAIPMGQSMAQGIESPVGSKEWFSAVFQSALMAAPGIELARGLRGKPAPTKPSGSDGGTPPPPPVQTKPQPAVEPRNGIVEPESQLMPVEAGLQEPMPASFGRTEGQPAGKPVTQRFQEPTGPPVEDAQVAGELGLPIEPLISPETGQPIPRNAVGVTDAIDIVQRRNAPEPVNPVRTGEFEQPGYTAIEGPEPPPIQVPPVQKTGVSKIGQSIEAKAVEAKLTKGFGETAGFDPITIADQAARATNFVQSAPLEARAVVRGEKPLPPQLRGTSLITAMEEQLLRKPDPQLAYELANSPLTSATSAAAQEMRLMAERVPDSITSKFQEIRAAREAGSKLRGETPQKVVGEIQAEIVKNSSKRPNWDAFVREITCVT